MSCETVSMAKGAEFSALSQHPQALGYGVGKRTRSLATKLRIDAFEPPNQVENFSPRIGSARRVAKMRATAEWPIRVDQTIAASEIEQGTHARRGFRQPLSSRRA